MDASWSVDRRDMLGVLGWAAAATALPGMAFAQTGATSQANKTGAGDSHKYKLDECLKACSDCMDACNETFHHCFQQLQSGNKGHAATLHYTVDCQEFCATSAKLIGRQSPLMVTSCEACARACDECAGACEKLSSDEKMMLCAQACRACARSCREMVATMGGRAPHP